MIVLWWQLCEDVTRREICMRLKSIYRMPGRVITLAGTVPDAMYMIRHGTVEVTGRHAVKFILGRGQMFGEMGFQHLLLHDGQVALTLTVVLQAEK